MKFPKLTIFGSAPRNLEYYIYRFKNQLPNTDLEYLINDHDPICKLTEYVDPMVSKSIKNFKLFVEEHPTGESDYIALSAPFDINYANTSYIINLKNDKLAIPFIRIIVTIVNYVITQVDIYHDVTWLKTITLPLEIDETIKKLKNNSVLLSNEYKEYKTISIDFNAQVFELLDNGVINPLHPAGPAHGVFDPVITTLETKDKIIFYQERDNFKNTYFYKIIGVRTDAALTELSKTIVCEVGQTGVSITSVLESTSNLSDPTPIWTVVDTKTAEDELEALKDREHLTVEKFEVLKKEDIYVDDTDLALDNIRELKIVNPWFRDNRKRMLRDKKAFRVKNFMPPYTTEYCEPIVFPGQLEVMVDKIVVLRRKQTTMDATPIPFNSPTADVLKIFVRQGGEYFKDYFLNDVEINTDEEHKVVAITMDSRFPLLNVKDYCLRTYKYNYTIYLYDEFKRISAPIVVVV